MSKEEYLRLLEQDRKPIKKAYDARLQQFREEFKPEKLQAATGWISARARI